MKFLFTLLILMTSSLALAKPFQIIVVIRGEHYGFEVNTEMTVNDLKTLIERKTGIPRAMQRLSTGTVHLVDGLLSQTYRIGPDSNIFLYLRRNRDGHHATLTELFAGDFIRHFFMHKPSLVRILRYSVEKFRL